MARGAKPGERRGGRKKGVPNKITADVKAAALVHGPRAVAALAQIMDDLEQPAAARVAAANAILDRAYGKPTQAVHHSDPGGGPVKVRHECDFSGIISAFRPEGG